MKVEVEYKVYSERPKGEIISQNRSETPPQEGLDNKGCHQRRPANIIVPDLAGWNYRQAEMLLEAMGFRVTVVRFIPTPMTSILSKASSRREDLEEGSLVTLRVSETPKTSAPTTTAGYDWPWF